MDASFAASAAYSILIQTARTSAFATGGHTRSAVAKLWMGIMLAEAAKRCRSYRLGWSWQRHLRAVHYPIGKWVEQVAEVWIGT
jgi:hypothetical protein